jgi:hypothetical protein
MKLVAATLATLFLCLATPSVAHNQYPFSDAIGENLNLTTCDDAVDKIIALGARKESMEGILKFKDTPEMHDMLDPKIEMIEQYIIWIDKWMNDNCAAA